MRAGLLDFNIGGVLLLGAPSCSIGGGPGV